MYESVNMMPDAEDWASNRIYELTRALAEMTDRKNLVLKQWSEHAAELEAEIKEKEDKTDDTR